MLSGEIVPVLCGSATENMGVEEIQQAVINYVPSPDSAEIVGAEPETEEPQEVDQSADGSLVALVFKTTADPFVGKLSLFRVYGGVMKGSTEVWDANQEQSERIGQIYTMCGKSQEATPEVGPGDIGAVAKLASATTNDTLCHRDSPVLLESIVYPEGHYTMSVSPKSQGGPGQDVVIAGADCGGRPELEACAGTIDERDSAYRCRGRTPGYDGRPDKAEVRDGADASAPEGPVS